MSITVETNGKQQCVTLAGELTIFTVSELWQSLQQTLSNAQQVEIDLLGVSDIDAAGLQLLMMASKSAQDDANSVRFQNHSQSVIDALDLLDLAAYFEDSSAIKTDNCEVQS